MNHTSLDETDLKLLRLLQEDARLTTKQLAAQASSGRISVEYTAGAENRAILYHCRIHKRK